MPTYFSGAGLMTSRQTCKPSLETPFLLEIVQVFKKIIAYMPPGIFPSTLTASLRYETLATSTEEITLSLEGSVIFLYSRVYGEPYPLVPTGEQIKKINDIWIGIGHPENIIVFNK